MTIDLLCFPHAGAGASLYRPFERRAFDVISVVPVQLPGREELFLDPPPMSVEEAVDRAVVAHANRLTAGPVAVFGHSFGAVLAFEAARRILALPGTQLVHVLVSGCPGPENQRRGRSHLLSDEDLVGSVEQLAGYRHPALQDPELREILLPALRADLFVHETYVPTDTRPLPAPITALRGDEDALVTSVQASEWAAFTEAGFEMRDLPGDHMYFVDAWDALWGTVEDSLTSIASAGGVTPALSRRAARS